MPTAVPVMVVPCPDLYPAGRGSTGLVSAAVPGWDAQAATTTGGQGELAPYFMHNCWCESRIRVVDLSRSCLSLMIRLEIGKRRDLSW